MDIKQAEDIVASLISDLKRCIEKAKEEDQKKGGNTDHNSNGWIDWIKSTSESYWT